MSPASVAELMGEILEVDEMSVDENFFDLGGNSFMALTLIARVQQIWGAKLSMLEVVRASTPTGLSEVIAGQLTVPMDQANR